eukprot:CAMPEP_0178513510 /NCGR_PEP_ID=MMETSP0696-20121128/23517_1 /TAXON_ID=265572 /ORGANISM="Extubocellulus spinifer, Strain CCMP396" /LENGTH=301 /DNA_ID=CAMNT_0020143521 /DNA_START=104 /DNA_END=1009 /DNA_ORIENTATION=+
MPLGYINRPTSVSRSVSFGVVEPYIDVAHFSSQKLASSSSPGDVKKAFPGRNRRIKRSFSSDQAALEVAAQAILLDSTNRTAARRSSSFMFSSEPTLTPFVDPRFSKTTSGEQDEEDPAQDDVSDSIFRADTPVVRNIHRFEHTIGEVSDEDDDGHSDDDSCDLSIFSLKRANPIYDSDDDSEYESPSKRSRHGGFFEEEEASALSYDIRELAETNEREVEGTAVEEAVAAAAASSSPAVTAASPLMYYSPETAWSRTEKEDEIMEINWSSSCEAEEGYVIPTALSEESRSDDAMHEPSAE